MLALQYFKKATCEVVLNTLAHTGQVGPALYVLGQGPTPTQVEDLQTYPIPLEEIIHPDDLGFLRTLHEIMEDPSTFASCLVIPQFQLVYGHEDGMEKFYTVSLYDERGHYCPAIQRIFKEKRPTNVQIFPVITLTYEYPVATEIVEAGTQFYGPKYQQISGCTWQVIHLQPRPLNLGYEAVRSTEVGSEYGQSIDTQLIGRGLKPGILLENSRYRGHTPWSLTTNEAIATLLGSQHAEPLPETNK